MKIIVALETQAATDPRIASTIQVIGTVLVFYEYLLTLKDEVRCIWMRRPSGATVTFVALRYGTLLYAAVGVAGIPLSGPGNNHVCSMLRLSHVITEEVSFAGLVLFCCLRMYAITNKNKILSASVALLMSAFLSLQLYESLSAAHTYAYLFPYHGCYSLAKSSATLKTDRTIEYIGMGASLSGELLLQLATWATTYKIFKSLRRLKMKHRLPMLLLRDGTFIFCFLLIWILTSELTFNQRLTGLTNAVVSIPVCRFILRLRQVYLPAYPTTSTSAYQVAPSFIAGNMGASIHFAAEDDGQSSSEYEDIEEVIIISSRPLETSLSIS